MAGMTLYEIHDALSRIPDPSSTDTNVDEVKSVVVGGRRRVIFKPDRPRDPLIRELEEVQRLVAKGSDRSLYDAMWALKNLIRELKS